MDGMIAEHSVFAFIFDSEQVNTDVEVFWNSLFSYMREFCFRMSMSVYNALLET